MVLKNYQLILEVYHCLNKLRKCNNFAAFRYGVPLVMNSSNLYY